MQHLTPQQQQQQQHGNMYAYATPPVTGFGFPHAQVNQQQTQPQQQQQQQPAWQWTQQQQQQSLQQPQPSSFQSHLPAWKQHPHIPPLQSTFSSNPHAPAASSMWRCKRPRDAADCLEEATPAELPPASKRMHTQSDDSTLAVDSRRSSGELAAAASAAVDSDTSTATAQSSSSAMEDLSSPPCSSPADDIVCASPLSDDEPTARRRGETSAAGSADGTAPQSSSADIEIDTDQWRRLQVNDEFAPLLNQMKSEQARNAAGFGSSASGRAVWDRYAPNPRNESALAHASVLSIIPPSQSLILYKPSRTPAAICQIDSDSEGSLSPNTIAVFTPAAAAAAAAAASSSTAQPCPAAAVCLPMRPGSLPHAGWKRRRLSDDAELPLYTPTCTVEELSDCDEQSTKRPRRRSSTTPISAPGTPGSQCMQDSLPPSPVHMATSQLDDAINGSGALSMLPPSSSSATSAAHSAALCSSSFPSRLSGPQTWPSTIHPQQQQQQQGPLANGFAPSQWQSSNAAAAFPLPPNAAHMTSW